LQTLGYFVQAIIALDHVSFSKPSPISLNFSSKQSYAMNWVNKKVKLINQLH